MLRTTLLTSFLASSALALAVTPALADKKDRAHEAIAAAEAKLRTAESLGTGVEVPAATAAARAALATAHEDLASGRKSASIDDAIRASALADTAIGELQRRKDAAVVAAHETERERVAAAHDQAASAHDQASAAQQQAAAAQQQALTSQQQAAEANARAAAAEQAAASSAADAAAARAAAAAQPAQVETTVTTQHRGAVHRSTKTHVTRRATAPAATSSTSDEVTTTTTVTPH
jgi:hypothetical protein